MAILGNSRFFLILVLKCVAVSYRKGRWRGFGDKVPQIPTFGYARREFRVIFLTMRRSSLANGNNWVLRDSEHTCVFP